MKTINYVFLAGLTALLIASSGQSADQIPDALEKLPSLGNFQPDDEFLNSVIVLRPGVADLGDMKVKDFVELISKVGRRDGTGAGIKGWAKDDNTYKLNADIGEPVLIEFVFNGMTSQLQPFKTKNGTVSPEVLTMRLAMNAQEAALRVAQQEVKRIRSEIQGLDTKQQEQLALVDQGVDKGLDFLRANIEAWKQELTKLSNRQTELRDRIGPVLSERVGIESRFYVSILAIQQQIQQIASLNAQALRSAAKLVNDAIINQNLKTELIPKTGQIRSPGVAAHQDTIFAIWGLVGASEDRSIRAALLAEQPEENPERPGDWQDIFCEFPPQITDRSVRQSFLDLHQGYHKREQEMEALLEKIRSVQGDQKLALRKFDYDNEEKVEGYQQRLSGDRKLMDELLEVGAEQPDVAAKIAREEAILSLPKENLQQALREEIRQSFTETRQSLERLLAALLR